MILVGFSTTNGFFSGLVRRFTKSKASHAFLAYEAMGIWWVLEADWNGIKTWPLSKFQKVNKIVALLAIKEIKPENLHKTIDLIGDSYDYGTLFGSIFPLIGKWFKKKWHNPFNSPKAMICSEVVVAALQECKFPGADSLISNDCTPEDVLEFLSKALATS